MIHLDGIKALSSNDQASIKGNGEYIHLIVGRRRVQKKIHLIVGCVYYATFRRSEGV